MYHLVQNGKIRSQVINVPEGLPEILSDITREVLRCQPTTECLCQFIIDYLHSVILTREKARIAKSTIDQALRVVDEVIGDMCVCDIPKEKSDRMCAAMEECFRRFLTQRRCEKRKEQEVLVYKDLDMLDELMQKCKLTEEELNSSKPVIEAAYQKFVDVYMSTKHNNQGMDSLYQYFKARELKRMEDRLKAEAAIKIQATFRGFLARSRLFIEFPEKPLSLPHSDSEDDRDQVEEAAKTIQKFFRRHLNNLKAKDEEEKDKFEETCDLVSDISLTARPADYHDLPEDASEKPQEVEKLPPDETEKPLEDKVESGETNVEDQEEASVTNEIEVE